jgi:hypothetical protein
MFLMPLAQMLVVAQVEYGYQRNALLNTITGSTTYDASILQFDFVPASDLLEFQYVFGSDEYPEFAPPQSSSYNDVSHFCYLEV